jgi:hypothetical protein
LYLTEGRGTTIQIQALGIGPAPYRGTVREEIRWRLDPASGGVYEVQPERVTEKGELRFRH